MLTVTHLARVYMHVYVTTHVKNTTQYVLLAMLRIARFAMNHKRFIVMATLTSSTDMRNVHSLYHKTL